MTIHNLATVAALQAITPALGDKAVVAGYHQPGDLSGGLYAWGQLEVVAASFTDPIEVETAEPHGFAAGAEVFIAGVGGNLSANGKHTITVLTPTTFYLDGSIGSGSYTSGGTVAPAPAVIEDVTGTEITITGASNALPIVVSSASHPFLTGEAVAIEGVGGNTAANGLWIVTRVSSTQFSLDGSSGNGTYTSGGKAYTTTITTRGDHGLASKQQAVIAGIDDMTDVAAVNGRRRVFSLTPTTFSVPVKVDSNDYSNSGGAVGDGRSIPSEQATGLWLRVDREHANARHFGAFGDGTTDDTAALQAALSSLGKYTTDVDSGELFGGGTMYLPPGTYITSESLDVPRGSTHSNIIIEGDSQNASTIKSTGFYPIIQCVWTPTGNVATYLTVRDVTLQSKVNAPDLAQVPRWADNSNYALGDIVTSGLSNRLLRCTSVANGGARGNDPPFHALWCGSVEEPRITVTGTPDDPYAQVVIQVTTFGPRSSAEFIWSVDSMATVNGPLAMSAGAVALGSTGLTAHFPNETYDEAFPFHCSPPMGVGFSTIVGDVVADNDLEWTVIDGGCGLLVFNGGHAFVERVHFIGNVVGLILDGTLTSSVRDCTFNCANGIWITGANQRTNGPNDAANDDLQPNVLGLENCWFQCSQVGFSAEIGTNVALQNANFEDGVWYGWTTGLGQLTVFDVESEGATNGWFAGSIAPFNGNPSYPLKQVNFESCLLHPFGEGPAMQFSNTDPAAGQAVFSSPYTNLTISRTSLGRTIAAPAIVGAGFGDGLRLVDVTWTEGVELLDTGGADPTMTFQSASALSGSELFGAQGIGCIPLVGFDNNSSFALRATSITAEPDMNGQVNDLALLPARGKASVEIEGLTGWTDPWLLTGLADGSEGQILEIVNLTGEHLTLVDRNSAEALDSTAENRLMCPTGADIQLAQLANGFSWVRLKYSSSQSLWLVLEHSEVGAP